MIEAIGAPAVIPPVLKLVELWRRMKHREQAIENESHEILVWHGSSTIRQHMQS